MKVTSLHVERRPSYDSDFPNQLVGSVKLTSSLGTQEVVLSNAALSKIFGVITAEVQETARRNAEAVRRGMADAMEEPLLLEAATVKVEGEL